MACAGSRPRGCRRLKKIGRHPAGGRRPKQHERRETAPLKLRRGSERCFRDQVALNGTSPHSRRWTRCDNSRSFEVDDNERSMSARRARCSRSNARFNSHFIAAIHRLDVDAIFIPPYCSMHGDNGEAASRKRKITFFDSADRKRRSRRCHSPTLSAVRASRRFMMKCAIAVSNNRVMTRPIAMCSMRATPPSSRRAAWPDA
jgi:hypothetical protein